MSAEEPQKQDPQELREDIEQTREELGETVEALAQKADVKAQAQAKVDQVTEQAKANRTPLIAGGAAVLLLLVIWLIRRD